MPGRTAPLLAAAPAILMLVSSCMDQGTGYVARVTGIAIPAGAGDLESFDNGETFMVLHARMHPADAARTADLHGFDTLPLPVSPWIDVLSPANRALPPGADMLFLEGCDSTNRWVSALDPGSGRIWVVVFYPDAGGTPP